MVLILPSPVPADSVKPIEMYESNAALGKNANSELFCSEPVNPPNELWKNDVLD